MNKVVEELKKVKIFYIATVDDGIHAQSNWYFSTYGTLVHCAFKLSWYENKAISVDSDRCFHYEV